MSSAGFTVFDTAVGRCGLAWSERGIVAVGLPERSERALRERLARRCGAPFALSLPPEIDAVVRRIVAVLGGAPDDLGDVELDLTGVPEFDAAVYAVARTVGPGSVLTYGAVAERIGQPGAAQAVGRALGRNPFPIVVPCHRVVAAHGRLGGFSAAGGVVTKRRLLEREGAPIERTLFD